MSPNTAGGPAGRRALPRLLIFLLLLGFVAQTIVVQGHVHFVQQASSLAAGHSRIEAAPSGNGDSPADCPLCQEAATAGAYLLPALPVLPPPPAPALWTAQAALVSFALLSAPLGWLSRAPPE